MKDIQPIIGVYKISNTLSGRYYIGYSTNMNKRFTVHRSKLKQKCHDNIFLQRAYNLDGKDKFIYEIIHKCDTEEDAKEIELQYLTDLSIREYLYNLNFNNSGGDLLTHHPDKDKIREKILNSCKGIFFSIKELNKPLYTNPTFNFLNCNNSFFQYFNLLLFIFI